MLCNHQRARLPVQTAERVPGHVACLHHASAAAAAAQNGTAAWQEFHRAAELERQSAAVGAIVADAAEESRVNTDLASLLCARLDASRRATERLLGVLQVRACCDLPCNRQQRYWLELPV